MKKSKLAAAALLAGMLVLPGCGEKEDSSESGSDEPAVCQHVDENKDHECDLCHENVGEHADHDNDHKCDYCEQKVSEHSYGEWTEKSPANFEHKKVEHSFCSICGDEQTREVGEVVPHNFKEQWSHDGEKHWHDCTDTGYETLKDSEGVHVDENQDHLCDVCDLLVSEHKFSEQWSHDGDSHWHACEFVGCEEKDDLAKHTDSDHDYECDECGAEVNAIESISVSMPVDRIGPNESTVLTASAVAHGDFEGSVRWEMTSGNTDRLTLTDNGDNTCTLTGTEELVSSTVNSYTITAISTEDETVFESVTFSASRFPTARIQAIIDLVGEDYVLPYCTFKAVGNFLYDDWMDFVQGYTKNATDYLNVIKAFDNNGTFEKSVVDDQTFYVKHIEGTNDIVKYVVYVSYDWSYVDVYREPAPLTEFPTEDVNAFLSGKTTSTFVAPKDGTEFILDESAATYGRIFVSCKEASFNSYKADLVAANYMECEGGYFLSPEKTLIIYVNESSGSLDLTISCDSERVVKTQWSEAEIALMNEHCGCVLPFFDGGFEFEYNQIYKIIASSSCVDAKQSVIDAFNSDESFTLESSTSYSIAYTKTVNECSLTVTIKFYSGSVDIYVELVEPTPVAGDLTEWPSADVSSHVPAAAGMPVPEGTSFSLVVNSSNNITITVFGGDRYAFKNALKAAGYSSIGSATSSQPESFSTSEYDHYVDVSIVDGNGTFTVNIYPGFFN